MYQNKLVACVRVNGRVLREDAGAVLLPFGSEYTIYFKNMNGTKALIDVDVDGRQVIKGLIVEPGASVELERFVDDLQSGRKLRFIERTEEIEARRGIKEEDGLIHISYRFEVPSTEYYQIPWQPQYYGQPYWYGANWTGDISNTVSPCLRGGRGMSSGASCFATMSAGTQMDSMSEAPGITVEGSYSGQAFTYGNIGQLEAETHTMVIQLKGTHDSLQVARAVTVKTKKTCPSCGREWPTYYSYCPTDQTYLRF